MQQERFFYRICADEMAALMRNPELQILDTRDRKSFDQGHIESARHVTGTKLEQAILQTPKGKPVLIYCHRGSASLVQAQMYADFGFMEVYSLNGGYEGWIRLQSAGQQIGLVATRASKRLRVWLAAQGFPGGEIDATLADGTTLADASLPSGRRKYCRRTACAGCPRLPSPVTPWR